MILGQINFLIFKTTKLALKLEFRTLIEEMCLHIFLQYIILLTEAALPAFFGVIGKLIIRQNFLTSSASIRAIQLDSPYKTLKVSIVHHCIHHRGWLARVWACVAFLKPSCDTGFAIYSGLTTRTVLWFS